MGVVLVLVIAFVLMSGIDMTDVPLSVEDLSSRGKQSFLPFCSSSISVLFLSFANECSLLTNGLSDECIPVLDPLFFGCDSTNSLFSLETRAPLLTLPNECIPVGCDSKIAFVTECLLSADGLDENITVFDTALPPGLDSPNLPFALATECLMLADGLDEFIPVLDPLPLGCDSPDAVLALATECLLLADGLDEYIPVFDALRLDSPNLIFAFSTECLTLADCLDEYISVFDPLPLVCDSPTSIFTLATDCIPFIDALDEFFLVSDSSIDDFLPVLEPLKISATIFN
jgi:hypothetical protein